VLGILSVMLGIGVGVLSRLHFARFGALSIVRSVLRSGREAAISTGLPVSVVCDRESKRVYDLSVRPIGLWHFEDEPLPNARGAFGLDLVRNNARIGPPGRIGSALICAAAGDGAEALVGSLAAWRLADGFSVEADVRPDRDQAATIASRGRQWKLVLLTNGALEAQVALAVEAGSPKTAGTAVATTPPGVVRAGRFTRVAAVYDRIALTLLADGVPRARVYVSEPVLADESPFRVSDREATFLGAIDEVRVGAVVPGDGRALPRDVAFDFEAPRMEVRFQPDGTLDPAFHDAPVTIPMAFREGGRREIQVGPYGTVR